ncbi:MAG: lectin, partial [Candidatus Levybacteria bacterium CG_4_10_14_0_2_um_filter_35_8]
NIAVRAYGDGYRWVDIARANGLENPDLIFSGNVLKIPR